jgi:hypothetical protein
MLQSLAGMIFAFITIYCFAGLESCAVFNFASGNSNGFVIIKFSATRAFIFFSQVSQANAAIHATGSDK